MKTREEVHTDFINLLGPRLWRKYTDGGPSLQRSNRPKRKARKLARRKNRRTK